MKEKKVIECWLADKVSVKDALVWDIFKHKDLEEEYYLESSYGVFKRKKDAVRYGDIDKLKRIKITIEEV